jgi:predicted O-linked N-acetylglucosamine transferase (SPINDLY family)
MHPNYLHAHVMLAGMQQYAGRVDEAIKTFASAQKLQPNDPHIFSQKLMAMNLSDSFTPQQRAQAARDFADHFEAPYLATHPPLAAPPAPRDHLRIGYVSADFCDHPMRSFLRAAFALDRSRFTITCFSNTAKSDDITAEWQSRSDAWADIRSACDDAAARAIRDANIDILIDLSGHTGDHRLPIFFRRPAPLQITWLGYPNTTGLRSIDTRITDGHSDPPGLTEQFNSEELHRLPDTFLCFSAPEDAPDVAPPPAQRNGHITFGVFAIIAKITNRMIGLWSQILMRTPGSRLVLKARMFDAEELRQNMLSRFASHGIDAARIRFLGRDTARADYLARYNDIDILLDTFPYHGTTMLCEALYMGVPVITLAGQQHLSRAAVTLLTSANHPHLIATSNDDYVTKAVTLPHDLSTLEQIRHALRPTLQASALMNQPLFAQHLGNALFALWNAKCQRAAS